MKKTLTTSGRPPNGSTLSMMMVCGFRLAPSFHDVTLTGPLALEHYLDREAESNDPNFLTQSLTTLWNPPVDGVQVI